MHKINKYICVTNWHENKYLYYDINSKLISQSDKIYKDNNHIYGFDIHSYNDHNKQIKINITGFEYQHIHIDCANDKYVYNWKNKDSFLNYLNPLYDDYNENKNRIFSINNIDYLNNHNYFNLYNSDGTRFIINGFDVFYIPNMN